LNNLILTLKLVLALNTQGDTSCIEQFYFSALKDSSLTSMVFLKLDIVDSNGVDKSILIPNHSLYYLLQKNNGFDYKKYRTTICDILNYHQKLYYSQYGNLSGSIELKTNKYVNRVAKKGREKMIKHFFKNNVFLYSKYMTHFESVVGKLFDMGATVSLVDNGAFAITYKSACTTN
jgi:hypothetical protein